MTAAYRALAQRVGEAAPAVAVRSSAVDEDGAHASFAGQHDTFLNVAGPEQVWWAVARCVASFGGDRALAYRRRTGLPDAPARAAVLVQLLVRADAAGVVFSANPVTGARDEAVVNAAWGLGESVVSGTVTPDAIVVRHADGAIRSHAVAEKRTMTVAVTGGTREVPVPGCMAREPAVDAAQARAAARLAARARARDRRPGGRRGGLGRHRPLPPAVPPDHDPQNATGAPREPDDDHAGARRGHPAAGRLPGHLRARRGRPPVGPRPLALPRAAHDARGRASSRRFVAHGMAHAFAPLRGAARRGQGAAPSTATSTPRSCRSRRAARRARRPRGRERGGAARGRRSASRTRGRRSGCPRSRRGCGRWRPPTRAASRRPSAWSTSSRATGSTWSACGSSTSRSCFAAYVAVSEFADLHRDLFGGDEFDAYRLLQGPRPGRSRSGCDLWRLSRVARRSPEVAAVLASPAGAPTCPPRSRRCPPAAGRLDRARPPSRRVRPSHRVVGPDDAELHRGPDAGPQDAQGLRHAARRARARGSSSSARPASATPRSSTRAGAWPATPPRSSPASRRCSRRRRPGCC